MGMGGNGNRNDFMEIRGNGNNKSHSRTPENYGDGVVEQRCSRIHSRHSTAAAVELGRRYVGLRCININ